MYKLARWLYARACRDERERIKAELFYYIGWQPERRIDQEAGMIESEAHYQKRLDTWFAARQLVEEFFREREGRS